MKAAFLDANVLFSVAYTANSTLVRIWELQNVRLLTSSYAVEEARRNLKNDPALRRLSTLLEVVSLVAEADVRLIPAAVQLRDKDKPILAAALAAHADFLVTGDTRDFGPFFRTTVVGCLICRPRELLERLAIPGNE